MSSDPSLRAWVNSRPASVQIVMRLLPPGTRVKAVKGRDLVVPAEGIVARVASYYEDGTVGVVAEGGGQIRAQCDPSWLEVVEWGELTPSDVAEMLA